MRIIIPFIVLFLTANVLADDFTLTSSAYSNNAQIPATFTCNGKNVSPPLAWINPPPNTKSFALVFLVTDWPMGIWYDWILYNIPADTRSLPEGGDKFSLPEGTKIGANSYGDSTYSGPCPPDSKIHHYVFTIYALDDTLKLTEGAEIEDVLAAIKKHTIKHAQLSGTYKH